MPPTASWYLSPFSGSRTQCPCFCACCAALRCGWKHAALAVSPTKEALLTWLCASAFAREFSALLRNRWYCELVCGFLFVLGSWCGPVEPGARSVPRSCYRGPPSEQPEFLCAPHPLEIWSLSDAFESGLKATIFRWSKFFAYCSFQQSQSHLALHCESLDVSV